jgi:hypothetical protein
MTITCTHVLWFLDRLTRPTVSFSETTRTNLTICLPTQPSESTPSPSLHYSLTHTHRSIGYRNRNPQTLADSSTRLMYLRVYDSRDSSRQPVPSPSLSYSLTHTHRSIGYHNRNPQPLVDSSTRLMYLRVYDCRDISRQSAPSPSLCYSLTNAHRSIGYRNRNPQPLADSSARLMYLRVYDSRVSSHLPEPSPSLCYLLTHAHSTLPTPTLITITCTQVLWCLERLTRPTVSCCETTRTRLTICLPAQPSVCEAF